MGAYRKEIIIGAGSAAVTTALLHVGMLFLRTGESLVGLLLGGAWLISQLPGRLLGALVGVDWQIGRASELTLLMLALMLIMNAAIGGGVGLIVADLRKCR